MDSRTRQKKDIEGKEVTGVVDCSYCGLTSLRGAPAIANGYFGCAHNDLPTLKFAPKIVKGCFACNNNKLLAFYHTFESSIQNFSCSGNTALHHLPDNFEAQRISGDAYSWRGSTWSFFDGVQKEVATIRKSGSITVYKMKDGTYAVHDGEAYSHGETLKEAKADLIYKRTSRNLSAYESLTMNSKLPLAECIKMYRSITGACSLGTKEFCSRRKLKKAYTVREVIELTDGAYGNDILRSFFDGKRW